jgi:subtilisin-like proprotein convertase family protein
MAGNSDEQTPGTGQVRTDSTGEFFSVGAPLHAVRSGYVRRAADNVLYETVVSGRYAHVVAPQRSGKSSLVAATAARLENNGFKVAVLDLEQIGVRDAGGDAGRWYYSVAYRLLRQLRIRVDLQSWWQDKSILSNRQRLVEFYSEVILRNVQERIVVFVDELSGIVDLPFASQLLASIRAAHNARATDPEFTRLTFVLLGECDPVSLVGEPELSPFNVTQAVTLGDFTRADLDLFSTELNLSPQDATTALDRIFYWTAGQPYLSQKLARAVSREQLIGDIAANVDRLATQQLAGRAAVHSEPLMSHIHREIVNDAKHGEALLNLYGRVRKGIDVAADLGSALQRRLIAIGLLVIDEEGGLAVRNRLYETVFTARWANEHLPAHWRAPAVAAAVILFIVAIPFAYTQLLPRLYLDVLTSDSVELDVAREAWQDLRSFPGHQAAADNLVRQFVQIRARAAANQDDIEAIASLAAALPDAGRLPDELRAGYWDRRVSAAKREERRDDALLAAIESFVLSTPQRRNRARALVAGDYPMLLASLTRDKARNVVFDANTMLLTETRAAAVRQWSLEPSGLKRRDDWTMTALEVTPLVRRVIVDRPGVVSRVGLTLNLSHARAADLRIKVIAPSGRAVEINPGAERASMNQDLRIPAEQLRGLIGEPLAGTWSLSVRDEELGVAGRLVGWNLNLNAQGVVEDFQRGLNISDPVERETDDVWFSDNGRYAVARAMQSDSARVWDLAFATPVRAIAVNELEQLIGLDRNARLLVTATQDTVNLWNTSSGDRVATLPVAAASTASRLTSGGTHLLVQRPGDIETNFELWSLDAAEVVARLAVGGAPALVALDSTATRIAVADYDRAVRVWDLRSGTFLAQIDLAAQPSDIRLSAGGDVLGAVFGETGASLHRIDRPQSPLLEEFGEGQWQLAFSPS